MRLVDHSIAKSNDMEVAIEGIRSRSKQFSFISAKPSDNWIYIFNKVRIGSTAIGKTKATHFNYKQEFFSDVVITGCISGSEVMKKGPEAKSVSSFASFSPMEEVQGEISSAQLWTIRLDLSRLADYLVELEISVCPDKFIESNWLTQLPNSRQFTSFTSSLIEYIDTSGLLLEKETRAFEELIYINSCKLMLTDTSPRNRSKSRRAFSQAVDFIEHNLQNDITVRDIANHTGISIRSLQYCFEENTNTSVRQFIIERRLQVARERLTNNESSESIQTIAFSVGFSNSSYFSKKFRELFGACPSDYLK